MKPGNMFAYRFKVMLPIIVLLIMKSAANAQTYTQNEQDCFNMVQNKVAWNTEGRNVWGDDNIRALCKGTKNPSATIACFKTKMPVVGWSKASEECSAAAASGLPTTGGISRSSGIFPADAVDVDVRNGELWVVGGESTAGGNEIWHQVNGRWEMIDGGGIRIAIGSSGSPWIVNGEGAVFQRTGKSWKAIPAPTGYRVFDIAVDAAGDVWIVTEGGTIYKWTGTSWKSDIALSASDQINSVPNAGIIQANDRTGKFWTKQGETWVIAKDAIRGSHGGYERVAMDFDGTRWGITRKGRLEKITDTVAGTTQPVTQPVTKPTTPTVPVAAATEPLTIRVKHGGVYFLHMYVLAIDKAGKERYLYSVSNQAVGAELSTTVSAADRSANKIRLRLYMANGENENQLFFQSDIPANARNPICYFTSGEVGGGAGSGVKTCDGGEGYMSRHIRFKNEAGYAAKMTLFYFVNQNIGGVSTPILKTIYTPVTSVGFMQDVILPDDYVPNMPVTLSIKAYGTTKNDLMETAFDMKATNSPCYKIWGTSFSPQVGPC